MSASPVLPRVLVEPVLDRDEREALGQGAVEVDHLGGIERPALAGKVVRAVAEDLARGRVERDRDALAMPGALGRLEDRLDRALRRLEIRREASLVADGRRQPALVEDRLQAVVHLGADAKRLGERLRARGDDHELLQVEPVVARGRRR